MSSEINRSFTRREFLSAAFALALFLGRKNSGRIVQFRTLRMGLVLPQQPRGASEAADLAAGAALALTETDRAATLFRQGITLEKRSYSTAEQLEAAARKLADVDKVSVLIGAVDLASATTLANLADEKGILFLNVGATADSLRKSICHRSTFHVAASDAMLAAAKAAALRAGSTPDISVELWHSSLERYGGSQLNDRFRNRFRKGMSSAAWAGWAAVKIAWETSLRKQSVDPMALIEALGEGWIQFDAHKGAPLTFRTWDHQLRQPLYAVSRDAGKERVVAELPDASKNPQIPMRAQMDQYGDGPSGGSCFAGAHP
jgi:hypothetical protein